MVERNDIGHKIYVPAIDGLRAVAIFCIIFYHLTPHVIPGGFLGVDIFLVISGYLMTSNLMSSLMNRSKVPLRSFLKKRLSRIIRPMLWMCMLVTAYITLFQRNLLINLRPSLLSSLFFVNNWWQIANGHSYFDRYSGQSPFTHLWYLSLVVQLFAIWPIIFVFLSTMIKNHKWLLRSVAALALASGLAMFFLYSPDTDPSRVYFGTDTRSFSLLIGASMALIWPLSQFRELLSVTQKKRFGWMSLLSFASLIFLIFFLSDQTWQTYRGGMFIFSLATAFLIMTGLHSSSALSYLFRIKPLTWVGRRSYSYYLWYFPIITLYQDKVSDLSNLPQVHVLIQILLIIVFGELSYQLLENGKLNLDLATATQRQEQFELIKDAVSNPSKEWKRLAKLAALLFLPIISVIGLLQSTSQVTQETVALQNTISQNSTLISDSQSTDKDTVRTINNVAGLTREETVFSNSLEVNFVGDSTLLAMANSLQPIFPNAILDGSIGRQLYQSSADIEELASKKLLKNNVVLLLGSNGAFSFAQLESLIKTIGVDKQIFFVNTNVPRTWKNQVNDTLKAGADKYSNVHVIDWASYSKDHPEWFYEDMVHTNPTGANEMALFITKQIYASLRG